MSRRRTRWSAPVPTRSTSAAGPWPRASSSFIPFAALFAINAATFFVSAALISRIHPRPAPSAAEGTAWTQVKEGIDALALLPVLAVAVAALGIAVTIESGTWMVGVPELVQSELGHGAGGFSLVMVGYAAGSIAGGIYLARRPVRRKAYASLVAWTLYLPAYLLMGLAGTLTVAISALSAPESDRARPSSFSTRRRRNRFRTVCSAESWGSSASSTAARTRPG